MPKVPPCNQYSGPHFQYKRNNKVFCRKGNKNKYKPQYPPCEQYGPNYFLYTKNEQKFCRKGNRKSKTLKKKKGKPKKILKSDSKTCKNKSNKQLQQYANNLNINLDKYKDNEWVCDNIDNMVMFQEPSHLLIKETCKILKIKIRNKKINTLLSEIEQKIQKSASSEFKQVIDMVSKQHNLNKQKIQYLIVYLVINALYPKNFPIYSPTYITEKLYNNLIQKQKKGSINDDEKDILDKAMYIKLCHCTKKMMLQDLFQEKVLSKKSKKRNNYAICTNSVYNQRSMKAPKNGVRNCSKNFNWYRKLNYLKGKQKGGAHYGPYAPNKEIIQDQTKTRCFNSYEKSNVSKWPNRYACGSGCQNWA